MTIDTLCPNPPPPAEAVSFTKNNIVKPYPHFARSPGPIPSHLSEDQLVTKLKEVVVGKNGTTPSGDGIKGPQVLGRHDAGFSDAATIFNGAVKTHALALVKSTNARDVSKTVIFCRQHNLELSVKGGGNGVHGWSVAGHVILDLVLMNDVSISPPNPDLPSLQESFERLRVDHIPEDPTRRPSLADTHISSSGSGMKRSAVDAWNDDSASSDRANSDGSRGRRKMTGDRTSGQLDMIGEGAELSRKSSTPDGSGSGSASGSGRGSGSGSRSGSGSGSQHGSSSQYEGSFSTPATSYLGSETTKSPSNDSSMLSEAGPSSYRAPRVTYVNPSQTPTSAFPFVPTTFGATSTSTNTFSPGFQPSFSGSSQHLVLNTNPDPPPYTLVTFGAGTNSKQLDAATAASPYGAFHVPTSAFPVGSGQFISGGFGFIGRKHGMAMDNVVEAEMVLADGRIVWVGQGGAKGGDWKDEEDPEEVWWAIRGAGAVIGVVTRLRAKAFYLPSVYAGNLIYLFDHNSTPSLLRHVRDCVKGSPRTVYTNIIMTAGPPGAPAIVVFQLCFSGSRAEGDNYIQAISSWEGGRSLFQDFSERRFERQQLAVEEVLKGGYGKKWFIKSNMLKSLSDEVIDETCRRFNSVPDGCTWLFEYTGGGAASEVKDSCFPSTHREVSFTVAALHQWSHTEAPEEDTRCVTTAEDWINEVISPNSPGGPLPCFLQSSKLEDVIGVYGQQNYDRLKALKAVVDPDNFFRHAMWPRVEEHADEQLDGLKGGEREATIDGNLKGKFKVDGQ
ncbi:hypothetical protein CI109_102981 [Kwoniella shandongensis]|uniref:Uncharacterized protein n=1 Tax=Kwoniella shandongensis TaxID=1734106 RepID=A0A5M6C856_9TREE|nr:uncharacterized protein CI109_000169 [Kwoniella shandongensis]KAA5531328.1 hypothetical protein CI109_000169 [Kwoniella shandongensis]